MNRNSFLPAVTSSEEALLPGESLVLEDLKHEKKKNKKIQLREKKKKKKYGYHDDIGFNMEVPGCKEAVMA